MRRWEINFCVLPGATMKFLSDSRLAIAHPDGPPLIINVATGEAWVLGNSMPKPLNGKEPNTA